MIQSSITGLGVGRLFLIPSSVLNANLYDYAVEMDKFLIRLQPGAVNIERNPSQSPMFSRGQPSLRNLQNRLIRDDLKLEVSSFGNYVPIWVPVDSVQARKDAAKKLAEEEQKRAAEKAAKAAETAAAKAATAEAKDAAAEQTDKTAEGGETEEAKSEKPLDLQGLEEAAKLVTDDSKPQRKLSVKSSPKKKSSKKEGSPKPETEVKESPKKQGSPKSRSPKKSGGASPK